MRMNYRKDSTFNQRASSSQDSRHGAVGLGIFAGNVRRKRTTTLEMASAIHSCPFVVCRRCISRQ